MGTSNNRNRNNQQGQSFGAKNNSNQIKQTTASSFSTIFTTVRPTRRPTTTTIRTTRRPKSITITNQPKLVVEEPQQRAISSVNTIPAKITVNEQFQHFPGFQQHSAKKKKTSKEVT